MYRTSWMWTSGSFVSPEIMVSPFKPACRNMEIKQGREELYRSQLWRGSYLVQIISGWTKKKTHKKGQFIVRRRAAPEEGVKIWKAQTGTFNSPQVSAREEIHPSILLSTAWESCDVMPASAERTAPLPEYMLALLCLWKPQIRWNISLGFTFDSLFSFQSCAVTTLLLMIRSGMCTKNTWLWSGTDDSLLTKKKKKKKEPKKAKLFLVGTNMAGKRPDILLKISGFVGLNVFLNSRLM